MAVVGVEMLLHHVMAGVAVFRCGLAIVSSDNLK